MIPPTHIPNDIKAEALLSHFDPEDYTFQLCGLHSRNSYGDILEVEAQNGKLNFLLSRKSLYDALPEYLFHPINRFENIPENEKKERFPEEIAKQQKEETLARKWFAPFDTMLMQTRIKAYNAFIKYTKNNKVLIDILSDQLSESQRKNKLIAKALDFLPLCKTIRGNLTLITFVLRKILMNEQLIFDVKYVSTVFTDNDPKYFYTLDNELGNTFAGNAYLENTLTYKVSFWNEDECDEHFLDYVNTIEEFRQFIQDYFLSIESTLAFELINDTATVKLSDDKKFNYLNYNSNL